MNKVKIFTDSTSDLTPEIIDAYDISVVPLYVTFEDNALQDGIDISSNELLKRVNTTGKLPKTSAPSPLDFYNKFKPYIDEGKDIVYIALSSELSSTMQNAALAANQFSEGSIEIVDSLNLSTGIGLLVLKAVDYANERMSAKEIANKVRDIVPKVKTAFVIDTLDYLYMGGRCNALQSFLGSMLKIKPIVKVVDGKMILGQKSRGKRDKALRIMLDNILEDKGNIDLDRIMVTHALAHDDANQLKDKIAEEINPNDVIITEAGCVISSHCGPNTVGILYIEK